MRAYQNCRTFQWRPESFYLVNEGSGFRISDCILAILSQVSFCLTVDPENCGIISTLLVTSLLLQPSMSFPYSLSSWDLWYIDCKRILSGMSVIVTRRWRQQSTVLENLSLCWSRNFLPFIEKKSLKVCCINADCISATHGRTVVWKHLKYWEFNCWDGAAWI